MECAFFHPAIICGCGAEQNGANCRLETIREAGHEPFERDTLYRPVIRTETTVTVQV